LGTDVATTSAATVGSGVCVGGCKVAVGASVVGVALGGSGVRVGVGVALGGSGVRVGGGVALGGWLVAVGASVVGVTLGGSVVGVSVGLAVVGVSLAVTVSVAAASAAAGDSSVGDDGIAVGVTSDDAVGSSATVGLFSVEATIATITMTPMMTPASAISGISHETPFSLSSAVLAAAAIFCEEDGAWIRCDAEAAMLLSIAARCASEARTSAETERDECRRGGGASIPGGSGGSDGISRASRG